ncbi:hypothetical protein [Rugosimonospora africana]|uniref:Protein phosphatase 2C n=1 Tax=Rugosimonospora africana TaxID=556532 RepID=A0A8J3QX99_9ACTN|nr:hypothetical protein [Rugosimonospora africana]GIH19125.1 hypothetical protein Raf01_72970 [Rugosimonospora africana]
MIEVRLASEPVPGGGPNEDYAFAVPGLVGVLDGVTVPEGMDTGCAHGPSWYVRMLAGRLVSGYAADPLVRLDRLLATAICQVSHAHGGECDLTHPGTPASTVCLARYGVDRLEYLVLADSPLVYEAGGRVEVISDHRPQRVAGVLHERMPVGAPTGSPEHAAGVRAIITAQRGYINSPDGYWVASIDPSAAEQALTGALPLTGPDAVRRMCLLSDGASRAVERFELYDWPGLLDAVTADGPARLIARVRETERADRRQTRGKRHDDASAALITFGD